MTRPRPWRTPPVVAGFPVQLVVALLAQLVILAPVADTAYWGDDTANAYIRGYLRAEGRRWWPFVLSQTRGQWHGGGRLMPLGVLQTYGVFDVVSDRFGYKVLLIVLTLAASGALALVIRRLGAAPWLAALAAALPAAAWQLHLLHDPLISYAGLMQAVLLELCAAMLVFVAWLHRGGTWRVCVVAILVACACLTYESAYLVVLVMVPVAWQQRRCSVGRAVVLASPGLVVVAAFVIAAGAKSLSLSAQSGYHAQLNPGTVAVAWLKIVTSGLPIIGRLAVPGSVALPAVSWTIPVLRGVVVAGLLLVILSTAVRAGPSASPMDRRLLKSLLTIAAILVLLAPLLTAVAPQYQSQLVWGWGYLPMFLTALGWAMFAAVALQWIFRRPAALRLAAAVTVAVACGTLATIDSIANARVVSYMAPSRQSRALLQTAFRAGVLRDVPVRSSVLWYEPEVVVPTGAFDPGEMDLDPWVREFVNRPLSMHLIASSDTDARQCASSADLPSPCRLLTTPAFWLRTRESRSIGYVTVTPVTRPSWSAATDTLTATTRPGAEALAFVHLAHPAADRSRVKIVGRSPSAGVVDLRQLHVLHGGPDWELLEFRISRTLVASSVKASLS